MSSHRLNYDQIIKEFSNANLLTDETQQLREELTKKKNEELNIMQNNEEELFQLTQERNKLSSSLAARRNTRHALEQQKKYFCDLVKQKREAKAKLDETLWKESDKFCEKIQTLLESVHALDIEFDNEILAVEIQKTAEEIKGLEKEVTFAKEELHKAANMKINEEYFVLPNLADVTAVLQKESNELFGDPSVIKTKLSELNKSIDFLRKQIKSIKTD